MFHVKQKGIKNERNNTDHIHITFGGAINHSTAYTLSIRFIVSRETYRKENTNGEI